MEELEIVEVDVVQRRVGVFSKGNLFARAGRPFVESTLDLALRVQYDFIDKNLNSRRTAVSARAYPGIGKGW